MGQVGVVEQKKDAQSEPVQQTGSSRGQLKTSLRSAGYEQGRSMLSPRAIQKQQAPHRASGAVAIGVPSVKNIGRISDPVRRNHAINQSYHAFDSAMVQYTGKSPLVSNWFTYGQHASREAGTQIRNLQGGLQTMSDAASILSGLATTSNPFELYKNGKKAGRTISRVVQLMSADGLLKQGLQLALSKAGISAARLRSAERNVKDLATLTWDDFLIPGKLVGEVLKVAKDAVVLGARLAAAIPSLIRALNKIYKNMVQGNREIYENVAPACRSFLMAANGSPNGVPGAMKFRGDPNGFVAAAFQLYGEVKQLGDEMTAAGSGTPTYGRKKTQRDQKAHKANLLVGYQEQLVILQPIFDRMQEELRAMSGTMVLNDPNGVHALTGNWGDFYTRMGIDKSKAPRDPNTIRADNLPPLLNGSDRRHKGTISEYFKKGLTDKKIHKAPPSIRPL